MLDLEYLPTADSAPTGRGVRLHAVFLAGAPVQVLEAVVVLLNLPL
jgi:hypothetical protein